MQNYDSQKKQLKTLKTLWHYLWPKSRPDLKLRVLWATVCLLVAKGLNVYVPFFLKDAIDQLSSDRANIGAYEARLNYTSEQLTVSKQNLMAASSQIQDVDVADESTEYAKENILLQSGTAMLAQANQLPQSVLKLLQ